MSGPRVRLGLLRDKMRRRTMGECAGLRRDSHRIRLRTPSGAATAKQDTAKRNRKEQQQPGNAQAEQAMPARESEQRHEG